jgi:hypothetical protein
MKIYNEVVYQVAGNKLVRVSEDSFEYLGEVTKCKSSGNDIVEDTFIPNVVAGVTDPLNKGGNALGELGTPNTDLGMPNIAQPNLEQFGNLQNSSFGDLTDSAGMAMHGVNNFITQKFAEINEFLNPSNNPGAVTVDPDQSAYSGTTSNKKAGELATNKAKAQARSSLRINA